MTEVKRRYRAPVREAQAAETKRRIAEAAAAEFSDHGWAGATVAAIAARAQVTPQAVHLAVGGKAALLIWAIEMAVAGDADERMLADRPAFADVYGDDVRPARRLAAMAEATAQIYARAGRLFLVLQEVAATDETLAARARLAGERRLEDHRQLARRLLPDAAAARQRRLADAIWALAAPGVYVDLVQRRSWSASRYAGWLAHQLEAAVAAERG